jgi:hypothetical protein
MKSARGPGAQQSAAQPVDDVVASFAYVEYSVLGGLLVEWLLGYIAPQHLEPSA